MYFVWIVSAVTGVIILFILLASSGKFWIFQQVADWFFTWLSLYLRELNCRYDLIKCRPKRIILIRHGQSLANVDHTIYCHTADNKIKLSNKGIEQALDCGVTLRDKIINNPNEKIVVYYSPFQRCKETMKYILQAFNVDFDINNAKLSIIDESNNYNINNNDKKIDAASERDIKNYSNYLKTEFGETPENNLTSFNQDIFNRSQIARVVEDPRLREQEWGNLQQPQKQTLTEKEKTQQTILTSMGSENKDDHERHGQLQAEDHSDSEDVNVLLDAKNKVLNKGKTGSDCNGINSMNNLSTKELRQKIGRFYFRFETGESGCDVYDRVSGFIASMFRHFEFGIFSKQYFTYRNVECNIEWNVLIVTHGLTMRIFLQRFFHWNVEKFEQMWNYPNCGICVLEKQNNGRYNMITPLPKKPQKKIV